MSKQTTKTYAFKDIRFTDGTNCPKQLEINGKVVPKAKFWNIYHEFMRLSHLEQTKLIVKD